MHLRRNGVSQQVKECGATVNEAQAIKPLAGCEPCLVAFKVQLHIHRGDRLRLWHGGRLVVELPHVDKARLRDAPLTVAQVLEDVLPATQRRIFWLLPNAAALNRVVG